MLYAARLTLDGKIQSVNDHLRETASLYTVDLKTIMTSTQKIIKLLHDMGKNCEKSDQYQRTVGKGERWTGEKVIHSHYGGRYIYDRFVGWSNVKPDNYCGLLAEIICIVIMSHHGLFDCIPVVGPTNINEQIPKNKTGNKVIDKINNINKNDYSQCKNETFYSNDSAVSEEEIDLLFSQAKNELIKFFDEIQGYCSNSKKKYFNVSLLIRVLLSSLVNADHKSARDFGKENPVKKPESTVCWQTCCDYLENKIKDFDTDKPINKIRCEISDKAKEFAEKTTEKSGEIVKMTVPTGGGKTLSSLRYAVHCAKKCEKSRMIYVAPYNSILDQNYNKIKEYLPDSVGVLPHFGDLINYTDDAENENNNSNMELMYAVENWSAPVIATSMVQFLNTLFDGKISSIKRMLGLVNSVIILDEIQSIPLECINMFNSAIEFLSKICKCTVVLCTATQPPFDKLKGTISSIECGEMISGFKQYYNSLRRTRIIDSIKDEYYTFAQTAAFVYELLNENKSVLCILNTKSSALAVYKEMKKLNDCEKHGAFELWFLSAYMCPEHRQAVIKEMKNELESGKKVVCISTQVIEAGVDVSFEAVVRSLCGLDSIVQSAGRCNRNAEKETGNVYIINTNDVGSVSGLKSIYEGGKITGSMLNTIKLNPNAFGGDLLSQQALDHFYIEFYKKFANRMDFPIRVRNENMCIYDLLSKNMYGYNMQKKYYPEQGLKKTRLHQAFKTAGESFEAISDCGNLSVIVPYCEGKNVISSLLSAGDIDYGKLLKKAKRYMISMPKSFANESFIYKDEVTGVMFLSDGYYQDEYGFDESPELDFVSF